MKRNYSFFVWVMVIVVGLLTSCQKEGETITYEANVPVYMSFEKFRVAPKATEPQAIRNGGKIYYKDHFIFLNEINEGIHVIDNADPANPRPMVFYPIPGNVDMAIRGNILFADSYIDLLALDISDISHPVEVGRMPNAFQDVLPEVKENNFPIAFSQLDPQRGVITGWEVKTITEKIENYNPWGWGWRNRFGDAMAFSSENGSVGVGGSMARFTLNGDYLYSVAQRFVLKTIRVSNPMQMLLTDSMHTWRDMETLFRKGDKLFVGTTSGMIILSLENPAKPKILSEYNHFTACDPVVVEDDLAYVTLRTGNFCMGTVNVLEVIDISNIQQPRLIKSYSMYNPHGLGIDQGTLFVCDGAEGLKIFDARDPLKIKANQLAHYSNMDAYDVIPLGHLLIMTGKDGLSQYDYSDLKQIKLLSIIKFTQP